MKHEMNRTQSKNHNAGTCSIDKVSLSCHHAKNIYLKTDTKEYNIFINLLVNHIKIISWNIENSF